MHLVFFMGSGKEYQAAGTAYVKALVPSVLVLVIGSFSLKMSKELVYQWAIILNLNTSHEYMQICTSFRSTGRRTLELKNKITF